MITDVRPDLGDAQRFGLFRRQAIEYNMDPERALETIQTYRPHVLYGARSGFDFLFDATDQRREQLKWVKLVVMTGECIHDQIRERCRSLNREQH